MGTKLAIACPDPLAEDLRKSSIDLTAPILSDSLESGSLSLQEFSSLKVHHESWPYEVKD